MPNTKMRAHFDARANEEDSNFIRGEKKSYPSLSDRFSGYTGDFAPEEWDVGSPVGEEIK